MNLETQREGGVSLFSKFSGTRHGERLAVLGAQVLLKHIYHKKDQKTARSGAEGKYWLYHVTSRYLSLSLSLCKNDSVEQLLLLGRRWGGKGRSRNRKVSV